MLPPNTTSTTNTFVNFTYNFTDALLTNCTLTINSNNIANETNLVSGIHNFSQTLAVGTYRWNVTCTDQLNQVNTSETWLLTITSPPVPPAPGGGGGGGGSFVEVELPPPVKERPEVLPRKSLLEKLLQREIDDDESRAKDFIPKQPEEEPEIPEKKITTEEELISVIKSRKTASFDLRMFFAAITILTVVTSLIFTAGRAIKRKGNIKRLGGELIELKRDFKIKKRKKSNLKALSKKFNKLKKEVKSK